MLAKLLSILAALAVALTAAAACGQTQPRQPETAASPTWRPAGETSVRPAGATEAGATTQPGSGPAAGAISPDKAPAAGSAAPRKSIAKVTEGKGTLPSDHGQVWREYDISPYTVRVTSTKRPEQAIIDWILRKTGYEAWHGEPLAVLSANNRVLRVYHTPEMQAAVADLVDRFVASEAETNTFSVRVVTIDQPTWRAKAQRLLRPVRVQTPGASAWVLQKEDTAILLAELRRHTEYREHSSPHLLVNNGQSTLVSLVRNRGYVRDVALRGNTWPGFEGEPGEIKEGFCLEFSPLLSTDRRLIDAAIKCHIDQVEKMIPVMLDVPTAVAPRQRTKIEVPQMIQFRFDEHFQWPADQVLLLEMGMVAMPIPVDARPLVPGIPLPMGNTPARADLLVFVEARSEAGVTPRVTGAPQREATTYRGRY